MVIMVKTWYYPAIAVKQNDFTMLFMYIFVNISSIICDAQYVIKYYMTNYSYVYYFIALIYIYIFITLLLFYQHVIKHLWHTIHIYYFLFHRFIAIIDYYNIFFLF